MAKKFIRVTESSDVTSTTPIIEILRRIVDDEFYPLGKPLPRSVTWGEVSAKPSSPLFPMLYSGAAGVQERLADLQPEVLTHFIRKASGLRAFDHLATEFTTLPWDFVGNEIQVRSLYDWISAGEGMLAVTGNPGCGKSAVLGMIVASTVPGLLESQDRMAPYVPADRVSFDAILHLSGCDYQDFLQGLTRWLGLKKRPSSDAELVDALSSQFTDSGIRILADALDEAVEPRRIANSLRWIGEMEGSQVIVGTRQDLEIEKPFSRVALLDDLRPVHKITIEPDQDAIEGYAFDALKSLGADAAYDCSRRIGECNRSFLFCKLAVHEILADSSWIEPERLRTLLEGSPRSIFGLALERIARSSESAASAVRALAYSRGRGLPRSDGIWEVVARAIRGSTVLDRDIADALSAAGDYIVMDYVGQEAVFRLAHQTFREYVLEQDRSTLHDPVAGRPAGSNVRRDTSAGPEATEEGESQS